MLTRKLLLLLSISSIVLLLKALLHRALLDVVGELCGRHPVRLLTVRLQLGAAELRLSKRGRGVDHRRLAGRVRTWWTLARRRERSLRALRLA